jgi:hypothetical protein
MFAVSNLPAAGTSCDLGGVCTAVYSMSSPTAAAKFAVLLFFMRHFARRSAFSSNKRSKGLWL